MYENQNQYMYDNYDKGYKPDEVMYRLHQLQGRIASTISKVDRAETDVSEKQSEILQEVDLIRLSVLDIDNKYSGEVTRLESSITLTAEQIQLNVTALEKKLAGEVTALESNITQTAEQIQLSVTALDSKVTGEVTRLESSITQTASGIESSVTALDTRIGLAESTITQQATEISSKVSETDLTGNKIASLINQTATTVKIIANHIDLRGAVTLTTLAEDASDYLNELDYAANNATAIANAANQLAATANQTATNAKGYFEMWKAPSSTYINGAYIATGTIQADKFYGNIFTVGNGVTSTKLTMTTTDIGSHSIHSDQAGGFRISSDGSLSLAANGGKGVYIRNAPFVVEDQNFRLQANGGNLIDTNISDTTFGRGKVVINGLLEVTQLSTGGGSGLVAVFG
jgi:hypothetical protein